MKILITPTQYLHSKAIWFLLCVKAHFPKICIMEDFDYPKICIILILEYPKICIVVIGGQSSLQLLHVLCDETLLKISRLYAIITAEKANQSPVMRRQELHKRLPISKTISKNFLDKFLDTGMLYSTGIFRGSNKKEPKTLVNTGVSASFIVFYHRAKSVIFRLVIVP